MPRLDRDDRALLETSLAELDRGVCWDTLQDLRRVLCRQDRSPVPEVVPVLPRLFDLVRSRPSQGEELVVLVLDLVVGVNHGGASVRTRQGVARALEQATDDLVSWVDDPDPDLASPGAHAAAASAVLLGPRRSGRLTEALVRAAWRGSAPAAAALGALLGHPGVRDTLVALCGSGDREVAFAAARQLAAGEAAPPDAVWEVVADGAGDAPTAALAALARGGPERVADHGLALVARIAADPRLLSLLDLAACLDDGGPVWPWQLELLAATVRHVELWEDGPGGRFTYFAASLAAAGLPTGRGALLRRLRAHGVRVDLPPLAPEQVRARIVGALAADPESRARRRLDLGVRATDQVLQAALVVPGWREILVARSLVGDDGMAPLATSADLEVLDVSHTAVSDEGLLRLRSLPRLVRIELEGCDVTARGLAHLASVAPQLPPEGFGTP